MSELPRSTKQSSMPTTHLIVEVSGEVVRRLPGAFLDPPSGAVVLPVAVEPRPLPLPPARPLLLRAALAVAGHRGVDLADEVLHNLGPRAKVRVERRLQPSTQALSGPDKACGETKSVYSFCPRKQTPASHLDDVQPYPVWPKTHRDKQKKHNVSNNRAVQGFLSRWADPFLADVQNQSQALDSARTLSTRPACGTHQAANQSGRTIAAFIKPCAPTLLLSAQMEYTICPSNSATVAWAYRDNNLSNL